MAPTPRCKGPEVKLVAWLAFLFPVFCGTGFLLGEKYGVGLGLALWLVACPVAWGIGVILAFATLRKAVLDHSTGESRR